MVEMVSARLALAVEAKARRRSLELALRRGGATQASAAVTAARGTSWSGAPPARCGGSAPWRALYEKAATDRLLRARIERIVRTVPLPFPRFWLAALRSLGEPVDLGADVPEYRGDAAI
jgi:hypothetical protein